MIDIRKLKELVRLMVANDLTELDLRDEQQQVSVKRGGTNAVPVVSHAPAVAAAPAAAPAVAVSAPAEAPVDDGLIAIESPMVGTYYAKASPDKPPFLNVGDSIGEESVVCLIEAMKIFNEIKAEQTGTVAKILVQNGDPVEFGQPLILVKPE
ncbi:MAG: acetyl-CoA carboxylase biotin carboxyl carrier protein [Phycisphaerales bacterium]|jgi:acetyl-CoA carboxylase biotin carboxyl carrier protein|nr:acetyl-CoA carboxylase biotin carboxyl carrier protein [Phycisphaerales bacterium]